MEETSAARTINFYSPVPWGPAFRGRDEVTSCTCLRTRVSVSCYFTVIGGK